MNARTVALGLASGLTTVLLVGGATLAVLSGRFGESPGSGIVGLAAGLLAGVVVAAAVATWGDRPPGVAAALLVGYATFGAVVVGVAGLSYVNVPGSRALGVPVAVAVGLAAAVAAGVLAARRGRDRDAGPRA